MPDRHLLLVSVVVIYVLPAQAAGIILDLVALRPLGMKYRGRGLGMLIVIGTLVVLLKMSAFMLVSEASRHAFIGSPVRAEQLVPIPLVREMLFLVRSDQPVRDVLVGHRRREDPVAFRCVQPPVYLPGDLVVELGPVSGHRRGLQTYLNQQFKRSEERR